MLFKRKVLDGIATGAITLAFRRWKRPTVKSGGQLRTAVGVLAIDAVDVVDEGDITDNDARRAGYASRADLFAGVGSRDGLLYRIELRRAGPDPREALREKDALSGEEFAPIRKRLERFDKANRYGAWTMKVLELIRDHPGTRAAELAAAMGRAKEGFKVDVRKLKELGLTESLHPGYRLSPRGRVVLKRLAG